MKKPEKVLVTGVAGFIGSNLAVSLIERGYQVIGIDNLSYGKIQNLEKIIQNERFQFVKDDVINKDLILSLSADVEKIIHLAAHKIPRYGGRLQTLNINIEGTRNVLEAAKGSKSKVYIASTSDVYGKNAFLPFSEEHDLVIGSSKIARWSYAISKIYDEQLFFAYQEEFGVTGAIFRFFGSYGPHQHLSWWGGPQSVFISSALKNDPLEIHGDGSQTRSFCYITDTVTGIIKTIENPDTDGEVLNIGNDEEISIKSLAEKIWKLTGKTDPAILRFIPYNSFKGKYEDVKQRIPDLSKAKRLIDYSPQISLENGLLKTIEWQKKDMGL